MLDQMYARYTVQPETRTGTMAIFYGMINIAAVNALAIHANNMTKDQPDKKIKGNTFLLRITHDSSKWPGLVVPFLNSFFSFIGVGVTLEVRLRPS